MDDNTGYGPWRRLEQRTHCEGCQQPLDPGDRVQRGPDEDLLGECCGLWTPGSTASRIAVGATSMSAPRTPEGHR